MFGLNIFKKRNYSRVNGNKIKPVVLLVLDGFGIAPDSQGNAVTHAKMPNYNRLREKYSFTQLIASGESVGLPAGAVGNSEVGHLTIGAGRSVPQYLKRIDNAILDGSFFEKTALFKAVSWVKEKGTKLHIMGLVGSGEVHSATKHLYAVLEFCKKQKVTPYLHLFTDGRDSSVKDGKEVLEKLERYLVDTQGGSIATVGGRYFAMDRDRRWDRIEKAYSAMVLGEGQTAQKASQALELSYQSNITDEFIVPTVIIKDGKPTATIDDNDAVVFINYRADRAIQITMALTMPEFEDLKKFEFGHMTTSPVSAEKLKSLGKTFKRKKFPQSLFFVSMTQYHKNLPVSDVVFREEPVESVLPEILSQKGMVQAHIAESEKEKMVSYYFDGLREASFDKEDVIIVPSLKVPTYEKSPKMSAGKIVDEFEKAIVLDKYHLFVINFANPDMVAHTGNMAATVQALEYIDRCLEEIARFVLESKGVLLVTADHGNAEELLTYKSQSYFFTSETGGMNTDHSPNPVPFLLAGEDFEKGRIDLTGGSLADIAPTILGILKVDKPLIMTGKNLILEKRQGGEEK